MLWCSDRSRKLVLLPPRPSFRSSPSSTVIGPWQNAKGVVIAGWFRSESQPCPNEMTLTYVKAGCRPWMKSAHRVPISLARTTALETLRVCPIPGSTGSSPIGRRFQLLHVGSVNAGEL